jgi:hypothetical protein
LELVTVTEMRNILFFSICANMMYFSFIGKILAMLSVVIDIKVFLKYSETTVE